MNNGKLVALICVAVAATACKKKTYLGSKYGAGLMSIESETLQTIPVKNSFDVYNKGKELNMSVGFDQNGSSSLGLLEATNGLLETSNVPVGARCFVTMSYGIGAENGGAVTEVVLCKNQPGDCATMARWGESEKCLKIIENVTTQLVRLPGGDCGFSLDRWTGTMKSMAFAAGHPQPRSGAALTDGNTERESSIEDDFLKLPVAIGIDGEPIYEEVTAKVTKINATIGDHSIDLGQSFAANYTIGQDNAGGSSHLVAAANKNGAFMLTFEEGQADSPQNSNEFALIDRSGNRFNGTPPKLNERLKGFGLNGGDVSSGPAGTFKLVCDNQ